MLPEQFQLPAHEVYCSQHRGVTGIEPFGLDGVSFYVVHAGLDTVTSRLVPQPIQPLDYEAADVVAALVNRHGALRVPFHAGMSGT